MTDITYGLDKNHRNGAEIGNATAEGRGLLERWFATSRELERIKGHVNSAQCAYNNAHNALGKWMMPSDARPGEKFSIWFGDTMIEVTNTRGVDGHDYVISERRRGPK